MSLLAAVILIILVAFALLAYYYNRLVRLKNQADESWSDVDVQLKRRHDLIPNIVETVKGYAGHERETLEKVTEARSAAINASGVADKAQAENMLTSALKTIFALAENYPNLKASENFLQLQKSLGDVEDNIQLSRRYYNAVVRDYNVLCESFPSVMVANLFHFDKRSFFEIQGAERESVKVQF